MKSKRSNNSLSRPPLAVDFLSSLVLKKPINRLKFSLSHTALASENR